MHYTPQKSFPKIRLRRLRNNSPIRNLIRENVLSAHDLIQPIFLIDGKNKTEKIKSMPSIHRMTIDLAIKEIKILIKVIKNLLVNYQNVFLMKRRA